MTVSGSTSESKNLTKEGINRPQKNENNSAVPLSLSKEYILYLIKQFLQMAWVLFFVCTAVLSITEISKRDYFYNKLETNIEVLSAELADGQLDQYDGANEESASLEGEAQSESNFTKRQKLRHLKKMVSATENVISAGTGKTHFFLREIMSSSQCENQVCEDKIKKEVATSETDAKFPFIRIIHPIKTTSSAILLALTVISCAALGSIVFSLRSIDSLSLRHTMLGIVSGFVVYLGIRGGVYLFFFTNTGKIIQFNPYSSAFVGLMAGLYMEKLFGMLSIMMKGVEDHVSKVAKPNPE